MAREVRAHGWYAHALERDNAARRTRLCSVRGCSNQGRIHLEGRRFCRHHAAQWETHYEIVERIRSFPDRGIV